MVEKPCLTAETVQIFGVGKQGNTKSTGKILHRTLLPFRKEKNFKNPSNPAGPVKTET